ncbi:MAG: HNH endonuclease [Planctomycetota bacterium]|nr:HNH endonuclease [Planctomycetota bacterium]
MSVLANRALVLNRSWVAISTTPVRSALSLVYQEIAHVILPDTYETFDFNSWADLKLAEGEHSIRTVRWEIKIPEVILLRFYDRVPKREVPFSRRNIYKRDLYVCQYCGSRPGSRELSIDHIVPRSQGGKSTWVNCVLACTNCNAYKANRSLVSASMRLIKQPRRPRWPARFALPMGSVRTSWSKFINDRYWNVELAE